MRAVIVIPARGGSKGLPRKNLLRIGELSLVGRAVLQGLAFAEMLGGDPESVVLDTDSEEIAAEGRRWGAQVPFLRPPELALDTTQTIDSMLHLTSKLLHAGRVLTDVVLLQPTSPLRIVEDISAAWAVQEAGAASVITVAPADHPLEFALRMDDEARFAWAAGQRPPSNRRQDLPVVHFPNGAVYINSLAFLERERAFLKAHDTRCVVMPRWRSIDIDTGDDLLLAEAMIWRTPPERVALSGATSSGIGTGTVFVSGGTPGVTCAAEALRVIEMVSSAGDGRLHVRGVALPVVDEIASRERAHGPSDHAQALWQMTREQWSEVLGHGGVRRRLLLEPHDTVTLALARESGVSEFALSVRTNGVLEGVIPSGAPVVIFSKVPSYAAVAGAVKKCAERGARVTAVVARALGTDRRGGLALIETLSATRARFGIPVGAWQASPDFDPFSMLPRGATEIRGLAFDLYVHQQRA